MPRQEEVKQPRDVLVVLYVVREHGKGASKRERGLALRQVVVQHGIGSAEDGPQQFELGEGRLERRQHEIANAEEAQAGDCSGSMLGAEHEQEDLDDVVVTLEVAQRGVTAQDVEDDAGELLLPAVELLLWLCCC
jgi:hypothetical protein